jgi:hypothetical protein
METLAKMDQLTLAVSPCITGIGWIFKGAKVNRVHGTDLGPLLVWTRIGQWDKLLIQVKSESKQATIVHREVSKLPSIETLSSC